MLAFITLIGNRKHDQDGDSVIKLYSQGHYGDILLLDWSFVLSVRINTGTGLTGTMISLDALIALEQMCNDGSVICHHGSHRKQNNL